MLHMEHTAVAKQWAIIIIIIMEWPHYQSIRVRALYYNTTRQDILNSDRLPTVLSLLRPFNLSGWVLVITVIQTQVQIFSKY